MTPPMSWMNRVPTQCDTIDIAGIGEKPVHAVGAVGLDRVHVRGGRDLDGVLASDTRTSPPLPRARW